MTTKTTPNTPARKAGAAKPPAKPAAKATKPDSDEAAIERNARQLAAVEAKLADASKDAKLTAQRDRLIVALINLEAGYTFIAKTRGVPTSTNRGLCRVLMGGKRL
jgi:hypothetical protein